MICDDGPALSADSEIEDVDSDNHDELLSTISSLGRKRKRVPQRSEAASKVSEHNLDSTSLGNVSVGELLKGLKSPSLGQLQKRLASVEERQRPVPTPLSRVKADQLQRGVAYVESCKQASKWAPIVKKNRESEHLSFPLQEDRVAAPSLSTKVDSFKPQSDFEREIASVLAASDNVETDNEELTKAERQALLRLSLEEAAERRKELQKMRALMSYYEQKARRTKKIKSKKFHRIQRKKREAKQSKQEEEEGNEELTDKAERLRAEERMTLKHSRMSKWAKEQLTRTHRDSGTQDALAELHFKRQTLKQKTIQESGSEDEDSSHESDPDEVQADPGGSNPWLGQRSSQSTPSTPHHPAEPISIMPPPPSSHVIGTQSSMLRSNESLPSDQLQAVQEAFAGDDVVAEFQQEKEMLLEESKAKTVDLTMPGWGTWGGEGVKPTKKARKIVKTIPEKPRKDATMKNVIISETVDKKASKHLISDVPWPYTSKEQFDKTHSNPLGRHWNTEATFQTAIKPRVTVSTGCVIEPIRLTEDVQNFIKRTQKKKKTKTGQSKRNRHA